MKTARYFLLFVAAAFSFHLCVRAQERTQPYASLQQPLIYGLVVDNSGSLRAQFAQVVEAGKQVVSSNRPGDKTFLVRFVGSDNIKVMQDFSSDRSAFVGAFDGMYVQGGASAIIDAVYFSAQHLTRDGKDDDRAGRRALILITDGDERASHHKLDALLRLLRERGVRVYIIGLVGELNRQGVTTQRRAMTFLNKLATGSGGSVYFPGSPSEMTTVAASLLEDVRRKE